VRNEKIVESASSGFAFLIHLHPDGWLQFLFSVVNRFDFAPTDANEFNRKFRFAKVYIDTENDLVLSFELPFPEDLAESMALWDNLVGLLLTTLRTKVEASETALPAPVDTLPLS
jgi:hypothetical protein